MDQGTDLFRFSKVIILRYSFFCLKDAVIELPVFKHLLCFFFSLKPLIHTLRENNNIAIMIQQGLHIRGLYTGYMLCSGFIPVPFLRASRKEFGIFKAISV